MIIEPQQQLLIEMKTALEYAVTALKKHDEAIEKNAEAITRIEKALISIDTKMASDAEIMKQSKARLDGMSLMVLTAFFTAILGAVVSNVNVQFKNHDQPNIIKSK